jgi:hypothetical protein
MAVVFAPEGTEPGENEPVDAGEPAVRSTPHLLGGPVAVLLLA